MTGATGCPLPVAPLCDVVGSAGSGILGAGAGDILSAIVGWVVAGASWLLGQLGSVLSSSTSVDLSASWYRSHYQAMGAIAATVAVPLIILAAVQAVVRQSPAVLVRCVVVELPLAGLLSAVAVQLVQLALAATDALSSAVSSGTGADLSKVLTGVAALLVTQAGGGPYAAPAFVVAIGALLVVVGALMLWLELLVRAAAVYVAVLFLPLALASLLWPAVSHWCRRLVETLAAVVLSKFVVVAVLSLAVGAIGSGGGFATVLAGGALLLLAAFAPFALLRLVPLMEAGAALSLEGARHRVRQSLGSIPSAAASFALRQVREQALAPGMPGTDTHPAPEPPGGSGDSVGAPGSAPEASSGVGGDDTDATGLVAAGNVPPGPLWPGDPASVRAYHDALRNPPRTPMRGTGGVLPGVPLPLWGGGISASEGTRASSGGDVGPVGPAGTLNLERDELGPVLRWRPDDDGAPSAGPEGVGDG